MKKTRIYFLLSADLFCRQAAFAQVRLGQVALTGVTIIDVEHRRPLAGQTVFLDDGARPIPLLFIFSIKGEVFASGPDRYPRPPGYRSHRHG